MDREASLAPAIWGDRIRKSEPEAVATGQTLYSSVTISCASRM